MSSDGNRADSGGKILAVFDIDGTLIDIGEMEGQCYAGAIEHVTGVSLATLDWTRYPEPTSAAIVKGVLGEDPEFSDKERRIKEEFLRRLEDARQRYPEEFAEQPGAAAFLKFLESSERYAVAIATGCYARCARYKLTGCGIDMDRYPHATSSDTARRREIITLAVGRAGYNLDRVIYFGDGPWDLSACRALGIPFIGMGRKTGRLREGRAGYTFRDFLDPGAILAAMEKLVPVKA